MAVALWMIALECLVRAEINTPVSTFLPEAKPLSVTVRRGERVDIVLRAYGKANQALRFKVRTWPSSGRLSEPVNIGEERALVTYEHSGAAVTGRDHFSYAVQSSGGVSAPAEVQINVTDDPPILAVAGDIDFGEVRPGTSVTREVTLENRGGSVASGTLLMPEHWSLDGSADYRLDHGESAKFTLRFNPSEEREYRGELRYSSHPDRVTSLRGAGLFPLAVVPRTLVLHSVKNTPTRAGRVELENRLDRAQIVTLATDQRLRVPSRIELPPRAKQTLPIEVSTEEAAAFDTKLDLVMDDFSVTIPVHAEAVGALLRAYPEEIVFPSGQDGAAPAEAVIENVGGTRAFVQAHVAAPFSLVEADRVFTLEPSEKRRVHVLLDAGGRDVLRSLMTFNSGDVETSVRVSKDGVDAPPPHSITALASNEQPMAELQASTTPPVKKWWVEHVTRSSATLRWRVPSDSSLRYVIEQRHLSIDPAGDLKIDWLAFKDVEVRQNGQECAATIRKLQPGQLHTFRIVSLDAAGLRSEPSSTIDFFTIAPQPFRWRSLLWPIVAILLVLVACRRLDKPAGTRPNDF